MFDLETPGPPSQLDDAALVALVVQTELSMRRLAGAQLAAIAEGLWRGLPSASGAGTGASAPGRWVRSLLPIAPGDAARRATLAHDLFNDAHAAELTPTRQGVLDGSLSTGHAAAIVSALEDLRPPAGVTDDVTRGEAQRLLLDAAFGQPTGPDGAHTALDPRQLAQVATTLVATLDPGSGDRLAKDEDRQHALRSVTLTPLPTGMWHLAGLLTKTAGHQLFTVLQPFAAPRPAADGSPDPRSAAERVHDALEHAAETVLNSAGLPSTHGSSTRVVVSVPVDALATHLRGSALTQLPELPGRWPLSPLTAQTMACDADLVAVLIGPDGAPLDVGDTVYPFPARQRAAISERDKHCTWGTCTAPPAWCHVHHLTAFSRGGRTAVDNGALLCGSHHRHVHAHQLTGHLGAGGQVTWRTPTRENPAAPLPAAASAITALARRWLERTAAWREQDTG